MNRIFFFIQYCCMVAGYILNDVRMSQSPVIIDQIHTMSFSSYFSNHTRNQYEMDSAVKILDMGCGNGESTYKLWRRFQCKHIIGIDIDPFYITSARQYYRRMPIDFYHQDARQTTFRSNIFRHIQLKNVLSTTTTDPQTIIDEAHRLLMVGGTLDIQDKYVSVDLHMFAPSAIRWIYNDDAKYN